MSFKPATHDQSMLADTVRPGVRGADIVGCQNDGRQCPPTMTGRVSRALATAWSDIITCVQNILISIKQYQANNSYGLLLR